MLGVTLGTYGVLFGKSKGTPGNEEGTAQGPQIAALPRYRIPRTNRAPDDRVGTRDPALASAKIAPHHPSTRGQSPHATPKTHCRRCFGPCAAVASAH